MEDRIEWITEPARLEQIAAGWDRLAEGPFEPFLGSAWGSSWWSSFGEGRSLRCCAMWRGERLAALFPLCASGPRRLEAMANEHSPLFAPLAEDPAALRSLTATVLGATSELSVLGLPADDQAVRVLVTTGDRHVSSVDGWLTSPLAATSGDFGTYRAKHKKEWRELERRRRKLLREHRVETRLVHDPEDLEAGLDEGLALEASGWKGDAGTAMASDPTTDRFYRSIARGLSRRGQLRFSSMHADGALIAFDLAALHGKRYFLIKTGYDERLRTLAPGLSLRLSVIERCFDLGLEAHEFLGADVPWKRLFSTGERRQRGFAPTGGARHRFSVWRRCGPSAPRA